MGRTMPGETKSAENITTEEVTAVATETAPPEPSTEVQEEALVDQSLDQALKSAGLDNLRARDANGRFSSAKQNTETESKAEAQAVSESDSGESKESVQADKAAEGGDTTQADASEDAKSEDSRKALAALVMDGYPKSRLDEWMKSDPDGLVEFGLRRSKAQSDADRVFNDLRADKADTTETDETKTGADTAPVVFDPSSFVDPVVKTFTEEFGEDVAEPLKTSLTGMAEGIVKHFESAMRESGTQTVVMQEAITSILLDQAREGLLNEYPQLKNRDRFEKVLGHMQTIGLSEERPNMRSLMDFAARMEFAPDMVKSAREKRTQRNAARDRGAPEIDTSRAQTTPTKTTEDDFSDESLDAFMSNDPDKIAAVKAKARSLSDE